MKNKQFKEILKKIEEYDNIVILRHELPDFDALGSQFGLSSFIKHNFPHKKVYCPGENHIFFSGTLYEMNQNDFALEQPYLLFVVDTANQERIDKKEYLNKADFTIKIDHHPLCENYGDIEIVNTEVSAAAELITSMLLTYKKYEINKQAAYYLYSGIVGDSGRFQYSSVTDNTLYVASKLLKTKIDFQDIYNKMYLKSASEIEVCKYLYNSYKVSPNGVIYYFVDQKFMDEFDLEPESIKAFVNLFSSYKEYRIWVNFTQYGENNWRVSIRSRGVKINDIASKYNGGGHTVASGARVSSIEEGMQLINDLDELLKA